MSHAPLQPVIVIGMHRSGTTMITAMLGCLGLFVGADLENNHESMFFMNCNEWLLRQCAGGWDNPDSVKWLISNKEVSDLSEEYLRFRLTSLPARRYVGWRRYAGGERPVPGLATPWGWKDPRNTFTLPFWLRLFPDARVIHVYRNGVAAAASLRARTQARLARHRQRYQRRLERGLYRWLPKRGGFGASVRVLDLTGAFSLWEEYVAAAFRTEERTGRHFFTIKYEKFLHDPVGELGRLASFCGLNAAESRLVAAAAKADKDNGERFLSDPELAGFYEQARGSEWMQRLGYG